MIEFENRLKKIHEDIASLEDAKQLIINVYQENIAFMRLRRDLLCIELENENTINRILTLCRTGK